MSPTPGDPVHVAMTKWGDRPHWEFDCRFLGSDEHGDWLGIGAGTRMIRPGASYVAATHQVGLVPAAGPDDTRGWLATFHDVGGPVRVYVDITTPPTWDGAVVRAVDLGVAGAELPRQRLHRGGDVGRAGPRREQQLADPETEVQGQVELACFQHGRHGGSIVVTEHSGRTVAGRSM